MCYSTLCCVHQVIPVHSSSSGKQPDTLPFFSGSLSALGIILWRQVVRVVSSERVVVSPQPPETLHDQDHPFPPLCKTLHHSLLPMTISEQKKSEYLLILHKHLPSWVVTVHPFFTQTLWGLTEVWSGCKVSYAKSKSIFNTQISKMVPRCHAPLLTLESHELHIKQVISYDQSQNK